MTLDEVQRKLTDVSDDAIKLRDSNLEKLSSNQLSELYDHLLKARKALSCAGWFVNDCTK